MSIYMLLDDIEAVLGEFLSDEATRSVIKEKVRTIDIKLAEKPGIALMDDRLQIHVVPGERDVKRLKRKDLREFINQAL